MRQRGGRILEPQCSRIRGPPLVPTLSPIFSGPSPSAGSRLSWWSRWEDEEGNRRKACTGWRAHAALLNLVIEGVCVSGSVWTGAAAPLIKTHYVNQPTDTLNIWKGECSDFLRSATVQFIMEHQVPPLPQKTSCFSPQLIRMWLLSTNTHTGRPKF